MFFLYPEEIGCDTDYYAPLNLEHVYSYNIDESRIVFRLISGSTIVWHWNKEALTSNEVKEKLFKLLTASRL